MSHLDPKVASVLDNAQEGSEDEDALISALEADDEVSAFRERRLEELHAEVARAKSMSHSDHGSYSEVKDEKTVMDLTTQTKLCVVHFFKPDFGRCAVMDGHLEVSAPISGVTQQSIMRGTGSPAARASRPSTSTRGF